MALSAKTIAYLAAKAHARESNAIEDIDDRDRRLNKSKIEFFESLSKLNKTQKARLQELRRLVGVKVHCLNKKLNVEVKKSKYEAIGEVHGVRICGTGRKGIYNT